LTHGQVLLGQFHGVPHPKPGDAAYHDMARLFGFDNQPATFDYPCRLQGAHDHGACLTDFAQRLNAFFFGEHLTRKTWFDYGSGFAQLSPARTIYPGTSSSTMRASKPSSPLAIFGCACPAPPPGG